MRIHMLVGAALVFGMMGSGAALADAAANSSVILSGPLGAMTCANFVAMSPTAQADAVKQAAQPNSSLTSNSSTSTTAVKNSAPLDAGQLIAACQASPTMTVQDAFSHFSSSPSTKTTTK